MKRLLLAAAAMLLAAVSYATIATSGGNTTLSYTVSNANALRVADAFAWAYNYQPTVNGSPNPESKAAFADRMIQEYIRTTVQRYEIVRAREAAETAEAAKPLITVQ